MKTKGVRTDATASPVTGPFGDVTRGENGIPPDGWQLLSFEECIRREKGLFEVGKLNQDDYRPIGKYPVIDQGQSLIAGYSDDDSKVYRGPLPVVLFGDHTREFKYVDVPFICGADGVKVLGPDSTAVDCRFFFYFVRGANIPSRGYNRHYRLLKELAVPVPPLDEQRRIAHVLSTIQRALEAQDKVIQAARELKRSLMKHLFTYGPIPVTETRLISASPARRLTRPLTGEGPSRFLALMTRTGISTSTRLLSLSRTARRSRSTTPSRQMSFGLTVRLWSASS